MLNPSNSPRLTTLPSLSFQAEGFLSSPPSSKLALAVLLLLGGCFSATVRAQAPTAPVPFAVANLRPALANVQTAIGTINIARWKASSDIRANSQQDVVSMQRDLSTTLPDLMAKAEAASANGPAALSPTFAVFRNIDALYDVLLRVSETAALTGTSSDANVLEEARAGLEDGRGKMGAWLLQAIGAQDAQVARPQPAVAPAAGPAAPNKIVVEDGPEVTKPRKKKPAATPAPQ
jgi:hypothetical protein